MCYYFELLHFYSKWDHHHPSPVLVHIYLLLFQFISVQRSTFFFHFLLTVIISQLTSISLYPVRRVNQCLHLLLSTFMFMEITYVCKLITIVCVKSIIFIRSVAHYVFFHHDVNWLCFWTTPRGACEPNIALFNHFLHSHHYFQLSFSNYRIESEIAFLALAQSLIDEGRNRRE
jgi:hypothetical protein